MLDLTQIRDKIGVQGGKYGDSVYARFRDCGHYFSCSAYPGFGRGSAKDKEGVSFLAAVLERSKIGNGSDASRSGQGVDSLGYAERAFSILDDQEPQGLFTPDDSQVA